MPTGDPFDLSLIVFAALAAFVIWKLRSVLGERVDREDGPPPRPKFDISRSSPAGRAPLPGAPPLEGASDAGGVRADRWEGVAEKNDAAWRGLDDIAANDSKFDAKAFLDGARRAYDIIVSAFAKGDRDALRALLSMEVFDGFAAEIGRREEAGETLETAIVAIDSALIEGAVATPRQSEITVRFASRLNSIRRDSAGEIVDGGHTTPTVEFWTFARAPSAPDPNWKLVATRAAG